METRKAEIFLGPLEVSALDLEEARTWGLVEANLRRQGRPIEAEESMIAATALEHGLTLVTGNSRYFNRIDGLKRVDWEKQPPTD